MCVEGVCKMARLLCYCRYHALVCLQHMLTATLPGGAFWQACSTSLEELQSRLQAARSMVRVTRGLTFTAKDPRLGCFTAMG